MGNNDRVSPSSENQQQAASWFMRYRYNLTAYIRASVRNDDVAEDLLQEVAAAVIELSDDLPPDEAPFLPWAITIARFRILKHFEKAKKSGIVDHDLVAQLADDASHADRHCTYAARAEALHSCLRQLPEDRRRLIILKYGEPSTSAIQIANQFNIKIEALYSLLYRLRMKLKHCVENKLTLEGNS